jgi:phage gpG-like protein
MSTSSRERTGVRLSIEFDDHDIQAHLARLTDAEKGGFKAMRREVGAYMLGQIQDAFDNQRLFDGSPMPQSGAAKARNGKTLIDSRLLYRSYTYNLTGQAGLDVGSDMGYAAILQFGGKTRAHEIHARPGSALKTPFGPRKMVRHPGSTFVPRPIVGMTDEHKAYVGDLMLAELRRMA